MTASDALSGPQFGPHFMRTDAIKNAYDPSYKGDDGWDQGELTRHIAQHGLQRPIEVAKANWAVAAGDHGPHSFGGNHRLVSARELGMKYVPVEDASGWAPEGGGAVLPDYAAKKAYRDRTPER